MTHPPLTFTPSSKTWTPGNGSTPCRPRSSLSPVITGRASRAQSSSKAGSKAYGTPREVVSRCVGTALVSFMTKSASAARFSDTLTLLLSHIALLWALLLSLFSNNVPAPQPSIPSGSGDRRASITSGGAWPEASGVELPSGSTILCIEDGTSAQPPRFMTASADCRL